jgi:hypothetical protein
VLSSREHLAHVGGDIVEVIVRQEKPPLPFSHFQKFCPPKLVSFVALCLEHLDIPGHHGLISTKMSASRPESHDRVPNRRSPSQCAFLILNSALPVTLSFDP